MEVTAIAMAGDPIVVCEESPPAYGMNMRWEIDRSKPTPQPVCFFPFQSPMYVPLRTPTFQKAKRGAPSVTWATRHPNYPGPARECC